MTEQHWLTTLDEYRERTNKEICDLLERIAGLRKELQEERKKGDDLWKENAGLKKEIERLDYAANKLMTAMLNEAIDLELCQTIADEIEAMKKEVHE